VPVSLCKQTVVFCGVPVSLSKQTEVFCGVPVSLSKQTVVFCGVPVSLCKQTEVFCGVPVSLSKQNVVFCGVPVSLSKQFLMFRRIYSPNYTLLYFSRLNRWQHCCDLQSHTTQSTFTILFNDIKQCCQYTKIKIMLCQ